MAFAGKKQMIKKMGGGLDQAFLDVGKKTAGEKTKTTKTQEKVSPKSHKSDKFSIHKNSEKRPIKKTWFR